MQDSITASAEAIAQLPELQGVGNRTLPEQVHDALEEAIITGVLLPATRLQADDIAERYGMSRIPVREALRSLHEAGWVEIRPRYGVYVRERSLSELRQLFEARSAIEGQIARLAAERRTETDIAIMRDLLVQRKQAMQAGQIDELTRTSLALRATLRSAAQNDLLSTIAANLQKRARFYFEAIAGQYGTAWLRMDSQLVDLVVAGDPDGAERLAREHILETGAEAAQLFIAAEDAEAAAVNA